MSSRTRSIFRSNSGQPEAERYIQEDDTSSHRSPFERDSARILHSAALRRLGGKAQVITPGAGDLPFSASRRTRLTHSLECAQIASVLGEQLGCDRHVVEAAGLAHDLGHPPFGHNGELALDLFATPAGGFEGNAQSFRILTRLEPKHTGDVGLNLTRSVLDAATKYPWARGGKSGDPASPKFGVYDEDRPIFEWVREGAPAGRRCLEAQVMDWADDISYSVHDLEDAFLSGRLRTVEFTSGPERGELLRFAATNYAPAGTDFAELGEVFDQLVQQPWWPGPDSYGSSDGQRRLKAATSALISRFCSGALDATRKEHGRKRLTRYRADLVVPRRVRLECDILKSLNHLYVIYSEQEQRRRTHQREQVRELAHRMLATPERLMQPQFLDSFAEATDEAGRVRAVTDQIACLNDNDVEFLLGRSAA